MTIWSRPPRGRRGTSGSAGATGPAGPAGPAHVTTAGDLEYHDGTSATRLPAGANTHVLTVDTGLAGKLKWAAAGGSSSISSPPIVVPAAVDLSGDGAAYERYGLDLRLRVRTLFEDAIADAKAAPPGGRTLVNGANVASSDCNTTTANAHRIVHANAATQWWAGTYTAPVYYDVVDSTETDLWLVGRFVTAADQSYELIGLHVSDDADNAKFLRLMIGDATAAPKVWCQANSGLLSVNAALTAAQVNTTGVWLMIQLRGTVLWCWYNVTDSATPPTSGWTRIAALDWLGTGSGLTSKHRVGYQAVNIGNPGGGFAGDVLYYDHAAWWGDRARGPQAKLGGGAGYKTGSPAVKILTDWDLGSAAPGVSQPLLRKVLASIENRESWDSASWTYGAIQAAGVGASPAGFAAAAAVVVEGAGRYFSLHAKCASDGKQAGSLALGGGVPIPLVAT